MNIIDYKLKSQGCLEGVATVSVPIKFYPEEVILAKIYSVSVFKKGNERWISLPSYSYEKDGKKKYLSYIHLEADKLRKMQTYFFEQLDKFLAEKNQVKEATDEVPF